MSDPIRILIADDHAIVRRGLSSLFDGEPEFAVVAAVADGDSALSTVLALEPDVAVLDWSMPGRTGVQVASALRDQLPGVAVLVLSVHDDEQHRREALRAGAAEYVSKAVADRDLVDACRRVAKGYRAAPEGQDVLTGREREILTLIAEAYTNDRIARELVISPKTVERHRENILGKLGMRDRVELTRYAIRQGLVTP